MEEKNYNKFNDGEWVKTVNNFSKFEIALENLKTHLEYIVEGQKQNNIDHEKIENKIDNFIIKTDKAYATKEELGIIEKSNEKLESTVSKVIWASVLNLFGLLTSIIFFLIKIYLEK
jgi:hypothetical protein